MPSNRPRGRQSAPSMAHTQPQHETIDPSKYTHILPSPSKGLGLFAHTLIPSSTRIISEVPILQLREGYTAPQYLFPALNTIAKNTERYPLIKEKYDRFMSLGYMIEEEGDDDVVARVNQNGFEVPGEEGELGCLVVCVEAARINHSCEPNAVGNMNWLTNCFTVQVTRTINPSEEITISYIDPLQDAPSRQTSLSRYLFRCTCPACSPTTSFPAYVSETTSNRLELSRLLTLIKSYKPSPQPPSSPLSSPTQPTPPEQHHLLQISRFIALAELESLPYLLPLTSSSAASSFLRRDDRETALKWKKDQYEWVALTIGRDTKEGNEITEWFIEHGFKGTYWYWWAGREEKNEVLMRCMHFWAREGGWRVLGG